MALYAAPGDGKSAAYPRAAEAWHGPTVSVEEDEIHNASPADARADARLVEIVHVISLERGRRGTATP
jgi:hypothetical protein